MMLRENQDFSRRKNGGFIGVNSSLTRRKYRERVIYLKKNLKDSISTYEYYLLLTKGKCVVYAWHRCK